MAKEDDDPFLLGFAIFSGALAVRFQGAYYHLLPKKPPVRTLDLEAVEDGNLELALLSVLEESTKFFFCAAFGHWIMTDLNKNPKQAFFEGGWVGRGILSRTPKKSSESHEDLPFLITWNGRATRQCDFTIASRMPRLRIRVNGQQREITAPLVLHARIRAACKRTSGNRQPRQSNQRLREWGRQLPLHDHDDLNQLSSAWKASWWLMLALFQIESCLVVILCWSIHTSLFYWQMKIFSSDIFH